MDRLLTTILLVTDSSTDARFAARAAVDLAAKTGATLHLVHTWLPVSLDAYDAPGMEAAYIDQDCFEAARGLLATSRRLLEELGATVSGQYLRTGRAADEISALGTMLGADLIVVGSGGSRFAGAHPLGADAEEIVRVAHCPVLIVRGNPLSWPPVRIVIGDDGSLDAVRTVGFAVSLGQSLDAETMLVRALTEPITVRHSSQALAERASTIQACGGRSPATVTAVCDAAEFLCETVATGHQAALLVIGNRGPRFSGPPRLGRVVAQVLQTVPGSVLIVPRRRDSDVVLRTDLRPRARASTA